MGAALLAFFLLGGDESGTERLADSTPAAPAADIPVPPEYTIGPGDAVKVQLIGNVKANYKLVVGRTGEINFPELGPISVAGMPFDELQSLIEKTVAEQKIGTPAVVSGTLAFTDITVRADTPDEIRERIYERVNAPQMWDAKDYRRSLANLGFHIEVDEDWSRHVAPTYAWERARLEQRRAEFENRIGKELVERTSRALAFWVEQANAGHIGWMHVIASKP